MRYLLLSIFMLLIGMAIPLTPTLINLYADHKVHYYQKKNCGDKGIKNNDCYFDMFFYEYQKENPKLDELTSYFIPDQDAFYFILSRKCTNEIFYNPSATKKFSGKITRREYFHYNCMSRFVIDSSDFLWGNGK